MGRNRRRRIPEGEFTAAIDNLSHDGRGIARPDGKTTFIDNALPGETVRFTYRRVSKKFDEGRAVAVESASENRVDPPCAHATICGGCSLQHLDTAIQISRKQAVLAEQLAHFGNLTPAAWLAPLTGPTLGYRSKARLGVKFVFKKDDALVGFREKRSSFLAELGSCAVLEPPLDKLIVPLRELVAQLDSKDRIPQIEAAKGDNDAALIFRHLDPLTDADQEKLVHFCRQQTLHCYLQPGNEATTHRIWPPQEDGPERLHYALLDFGLEFAFHPQDFTQINRHINRKMVQQALALLQVESSHSVLDLFCGLGNFTLPLAKQAAEVVGIEGSEAMVKRGEENAAANNIHNARFAAANLMADIAHHSWASQQYDRILLDPPRAGAAELIPFIVASGAERVVYVSCNPATLARDAGELAKQGYRLENAGVMDMFPHTTHVESIALFVRQ